VCSLHIVIVEFIWIPFLSRNFLDFLYTVSLTEGSDIYWPVIGQIGHFEMCLKSHRQSTLKFLGCLISHP
jgi:hypothetical protein